VYEKLSVTVSAPREYDVDCPYLPGYKPPLIHCQAALDLLPWGDEALRFGPAENAGVDVSLPQSYQSPQGRCAIEIDYQATGDVISWDEINNALAAVFSKMMESAEEPHTPAPSFPLILQVGEQRFHVSKDTLSGSHMLAAKVSERWSSDSQTDGSYFVDADPEIFKHILRFLRHGVYPLCYDKAKGHDFATYTAIQQQADYLVIPKLVKWLNESQYMKAITTYIVARTEEGINELDRSTDSSIKTTFHPTWRTVKKYVCPRHIALHYDSPRRCGKDCKRAQGDAEDEYVDINVLSTLVVREQTLLNRDVLCMEESE
ncbi:MAG: hypothetical protein Q9192_007644, partial [Flavoplaca navasiana]